MENTRDRGALMLVGALGLFISPACIKDARECEQRSNCFSSELCIDGACQPAPDPQTPDMGKVTDMGERPDMATPDLAEADQGHTPVDGEVKPLPRTRYMLQETLDANRLPTLTRCALGLDGSARPHAAYIIRAEQGSDELLRYQVREQDQWRGFTLSDEFCLYANPAMTIDAQGRAHLCVTESISEQVYYVRRQGDALTKEPIGAVGDVVSECAITATATGLIVAYTAKGPTPGERTLKLATKTYEATSWEVNTIDADQHDVASAPALAQRPDAITLWYHATQGGQTYWRKAAWPKDRAIKPSDFTTKRPSVGTPLPFIQVSQRASTHDHVLLHTDEVDAGQSLQVLTYWDNQLDDLMIEGTVSPQANALTLSKDGLPSALFNAEDGAFYLAEADEEAWSLWALTQTTNYTYGDCAALEQDDQGQLHLIYQADTPSAINYHKLNKP